MPCLLRLFRQRGGGIMFAYEPSLSPPEADRFDLARYYQIKLVIEDACKDILKRGENTRFQDILDLLHEHINENTLKYIPEADYE